LGGRRQFVRLCTNQSVVGGSASSTPLARCSRCLPPTGTHLVGRPGADFCGSL